jgi:di/tricarboxylate transporter
MDLQTIRGLASAEHPHLVDMDTGRARYFEVVVGPQSPLMGKTLMDVGFRERYQAVVLAIHRASQRIDAKLGQVRLRVGDTLLLLADPGFGQRWRDRTDFLMISGGLGSPPVATGKAVVVGAVGLGIIVTASAGVLPILHASLLGALLLIGLGVLTPGEARSAVDLDVVLLIASAFGLAAAMESSGLAGVVSSGLVGAFDGLGSAGVLFGVVVATVLLTGLVTNNAAALLMFPVAVSTAATTGLDIRPLAVGIAVSASVDFLTPIGYQTNTMVYGPGGYRFFDYARLGAPLTLMALLLIVLIVPLAWPL